MPGKLAHFSSQSRSKQSEMWSAAKKADRESVSIELSRDQDETPPEKEQASQKSWKLLSSPRLHTVKGHQAASGEFEDQVLFIL